MKICLDTWEKQLISTLDEEAQHHPLYRDQEGRLRFQQDPAVLFVFVQYKVDIRSLWDAVNRGQLTLDNVRKYCRNIGTEVRLYAQYFSICKSCR